MSYPPYISEKKIVEEIVPGWEKEASSIKFKIWLSEQTMDIKKLAESEDPDDAALLILEFRGQAQKV